MMKLFSIVILTCPALSSAFSVAGAKMTRTTNSLQMAKNNESLVSSKNESKDSFDKVFKGGAFNDDFTKEKILTDAALIASKIKSSKDLGWKTEEPKRKGNARPRHRAWGGEGEMAIQDKANYDEENPKCVEKWLTIEDFLANTRSQPGPAADTVFVALAGGSKFAERDVCEAKIAQWTASSGSTEVPAKTGFFGRRGASSTFNNDAFNKSVQEGRSALLLGWAGFLGLNTFFAGCIVFPTNPGAKALESLVDSLKDQIPV